MPWPLLQAIADTSDEMLSRRLAHLQATEFLYETRLFPERAYTFKHALTHEVASASLLHERRRVLHARIVAALEALAGNRGRRPGGATGAACAAGRGLGQGPGLWPPGGDKALTCSAYREAMMCFEQALAAFRISLIVPPPSRPSTSGLAQRAMLNVSGEAPGRTLDHLHTAETLAQTLGDHSRLGGSTPRWASFGCDGRGGPGDRLRPAVPPWPPRSGISACRPGRISSWVGPIAMRDGYQAVESLGGRGDAPGRSAL